jgi:putative phosphoesterase
MRILIYSDIHSNFQALRSLLESEKFDKSLFLGDAVDYGPEPAETVDEVFSQSDYIVQGNHDSAVANNTDCGCAPEMHELSVFTRDNISLKLLSHEDIVRLKTMPTMLEFSLEGKNFLMVHASPNNLLNGYMYGSEAQLVWKSEKFSKFDYILVGHTHFQMFYRGRIINPGSAGQPRDGNWMPMYAVLDTEQDQVLFKRFRYDNEKTIEKLRSVIGGDSMYFPELVSFYRSY